MTDQRMVAIGDLLLRIGGNADRPLHVRLAAAQPHFANNHIGIGLFGGTLHCQGL